MSRQIFCIACSSLFKDDTYNMLRPNICNNCKEQKAMHLLEKKIAKKVKDLKEDYRLKTFTIKEYNQIYYKYLDACNLIEKLKDRVLYLGGDYNDLTSTGDSEASMRRGDDS
jgi:hypothetical protein